MVHFSLFIDDYLAEASPVLGRMRLDGLTEAAVPFEERTVLLWRRGATTPDMCVEVLIDVLMLRPVSPLVVSRCGSALSEVLCARPVTVVGPYNEKI